MGTMGYVPLLQIVLLPAIRFVKHVVNKPNFLCSVVNFGRWQPRSPVAYSMIALDESLISVLKQQNATMGFCVENITVNVGRFVC